jgi:hypothetical protein
LIRTLIGIGAAVAGASSAKAGTPSPALIGVQEVVLVCELVPSFPEPERQQICDQFVRRAKQATNLPVRIAKTADVDPLGSRETKNHLFLKVQARARAIDPGRQALTIQVTPVRPARPQGLGQSVSSSASLARVQGKWLLQGPIDAFHKILGSTSGRGLRAPITSEHD